MVPLGPQDAPRPMGASQMIVAGPPPMSMRFSLASAKKPIERLSGDQKGKIASSVPGNRLRRQIIHRAQKELLLALRVSGKNNVRAVGRNHRRTGVVAHEIKVPFIR